MITKRLAISIAITALIILTLIPACAFAAGGTISGKVDIPRNATLLQYINTTVDASGVSHTDITQKIYASNLTVYALNTNTQFQNVTHPNQDGSYSVSVPENGVYRIYVIPSDVYDLVNPFNWTPVQYPNDNDRAFTVEVNGNVDNVNINYYQPGQYVATNIKGNASATTAPTASATPAPGFAVLLVLAGLLGAFAIVRRNK